MSKFFIWVREYLLAPNDYDVQQNLDFIRIAFGYLMMFNFLDMLFTGLFYSGDYPNFREANPIVLWMMSVTPYWILLLALLKITMLTIFFLYFKHLAKLRQFNRVMEYGIYIANAYLALIVGYMAFQLFWLKVMPS